MSGDLISALLACVKPHSTRAVRARGRAERVWRGTYKRDGGKARRDEGDKEGAAPLWEVCDEEGGEEEDEPPLAGEGEGDPRHGERGERHHAREEGRNAWCGV